MPSLVRRGGHARSWSFDLGRGRHQAPGRFGRNHTEVLFDRICRENGIDHLLTAPRSPTTTGKIERFHRTLRQEFLSGRMFDTMVDAQRELDAWVHQYNSSRPHQSLGMTTPLQRFVVLPGDRPVDGTATDIPPRDGDDWVARRVASNGVISILKKEAS